MSKIVIKQVEEQSLDKIDLFNKINTQRFFNDNENPTVDERITLLSKWQGLNALEVEKMHISTINNACNAIIEVVQSYQPRAPREEISGLTHRTDYLSFTAGHVRHIETIDYQANPAGFMGLFYIEKGLDYGHEEEKGGKIIVLNPLSERSKTIKESSNLSELIDLLAFFLNISELLKKDWVLSLNRKNRRKTTRKRRTLLRHI